jgi:hypothetical protein
MISLLILAVILIMGAQFGIALTASLVVHPILVKAKKVTAIEVFKPFFDKTHIFVLVMSIAVSLLALVISILSGNWWWFGVSMIMHLNGPYTIFFMMPLNRRLMDQDVNPNSEQTNSDIIEWGMLHAVRTVINGAVFIALIVLQVYFPL